MGLSWRARGGVPLALLLTMLGMAACSSSDDEGAATPPEPAHSAVESTEPKDCSAFLLDAPYQPTEISLFRPSIYGGTDQAPASTPRAEAAIRSEVTAILETRFANDPEAVGEALALLDDPVVVEKVPDLNLRGALVLLRGTIADPEIEAFIDGNYRSLTFVDLGDPTNVGKSVPAADGERALQVNQLFRGEASAQLAALVAHEILHNDEPYGKAEESAIKSIDSIVYAEQLLADPTIASQPTRLAQVNNGFVLARFNSRQAGAITIYDTDDGALFPGSVSQPDLKGFDSLFTAEGDGGPTPGSPILQQVVSNMLEFQDVLDTDTFDEVLSAIDVGGLNPEHVSDCDLRTIVTDALRARPAAR